MPLAGRDLMSRAHAHMRWAERYNKGGNAAKSAAHFGRAIEYEAAHFGAEKRDHDDSESDDDSMSIFDYPDTAWAQYPEALFRAAAALPDRRGSLEINSLRDDRQKQLDRLATDCKNKVPSKCEQKKVFDDLMKQRDEAANRESTLFLQRAAADRLSGVHIAAGLHKKQGGPDDLRLDYDAFGPDAATRSSDILRYHNKIMDDHEDARKRRVSARKERA